MYKGEGSGQKKNPDAAELIRAKVGRITGGMVALFTVMKGLPLAYSKDMQELLCSTRSLRAHDFD